jgi:excisionase family DNA binding protein
LARKEEIAMSPFLTLFEAAEYLGFCETWVYRKCRAKILPHIRIGRTLRFTKQDLDAWINSHRCKGATKI